MRAQIPIPLDDNIDQFGEGDTIEIDFEFRTMASFAEWDEENSEIVMHLDFAVDELEQHYTVVELSDGEDSTTYIFTLEISPNLAPTFDNWNRFKLLTI